MKNYPRIASLLPYLDASQGVRLSLSLQREQSEDIERSFYPFLILNDTDPVARLVQGQFITDGDAPVRTLFLLMERDHYSLREEPLRPVTNIDVEAAWQHAFAFYRSSGQTSVLPLAGQFADDGRPLRLAPLFFCKAKHSYFHPPCPRCGRSLELCTDDDLLAGLGIAPYSGSMKRYLFCASPDCANASTLYAYERAPSDPPAVLDRWDLVRELILLPDTVDGDEAFPCRGCDGRQDCSGPGGQALSRLAPFSFYPFYLLIFQSMSVSALDFSSLLSGAPARDVASRLRTRGETGRAQRVETLRVSEKGGFLFKDGQRWFLEILYLKLSLLAGIVRDVPAEDRLTHPDFALSFDRIWVRMPEHASLLPSYWTFTTNPIDIHWSFFQSAPQRSLRPDLHSLGLVWFYVLVTNENRTAADVSFAVKKRLDNMLSSGHEPHDTPRLPGSYEPAFPPADVFWNAAAGKCSGYDERETGLWERSLALGWSLLEAGEKGGEWSREHFLEELEALRRDVEGALFGSPSLQAHRGGDLVLDDQAIHGILQEIMLKWRSRSEVDSKATAEPGEEEELVQTIVVSSQFASKMTLVGSTEAPEAESPEPTGSETKSDEALEETVVLSLRTPSGLPIGVSGPTTEGSGEGRSAREEELEETVLVSLRDAKNRPPLPSGKEQTDDDLEKTIIISGVSPAAEAAEARFREKPIKRRTGEEEMAETVIISASDKDKGG